MLRNFFATTLVFVVLPTTPTRASEQHPENLRPWTECRVKGVVEGAIYTLALDASNGDPYMTISGSTQGTHPYPATKTGIGRSVIYTASTEAGVYQLVMSDYTGNWLGRSSSGPQSYEYIGDLACKDLSENSERNSAENLQKSAIQSLVSYLAEGHYAGRLSDGRECQVVVDAFEARTTSGPIKVSYMAELRVVGVSNIRKQFYLVLDGWDDTFETSVSKHTQSANIIEVTVASTSRDDDGFPTPSGDQSITIEIGSNLAVTIDQQRCGLNP